MLKIESELLGRNYVCDGCNDEIEKGQLVFYIENKEVPSVFNVCICKSCAESIQEEISMGVDKFNLGLNK